MSYVRNCMTKLSKSDAIAYLSSIIDEKTFTNYFSMAAEFECLPRSHGERYYFDKGALDKWENEYKSRLVDVPIEGYYKCLDFAFVQHFNGYVLSDWGSGRQREFGQKMTNWTRGLLAEVAFEIFLKKFGCEVKLDFDLHEEFVPQDIVGIMENGGYRNPRIGVGIKSSKKKNASLVLSPQEVEDDYRKSDVYVFVRVDLPDDHLIRLLPNAFKKLVKGQQHYELYENKFDLLESVRCEIAGWCVKDDLDYVTRIPGYDFGSYRYVKQTGKLRRSVQEWESLVKML